MNLTKMRQLVCATAIATALGALLGTPVANASTDQDGSARWFGDVYVLVDTYTDWGVWVEGEGPDSYSAWATCEDGSYVVGGERWAGDPTGSFVYCDSGIFERGWHEFTNS